MVKNNKLVYEFRLYMYPVADPYFLRRTCMHAWCPRLRAYAFSHFYEHCLSSLLERHYCMRFG